MIFFLIYFFSFILISKSFSFKQYPSMKNDWALLSPWLSERFSELFTFPWITKTFLGHGFHQILKILPSQKNKNNIDVEERKKVSLLDLPDLTLECILERLSPADLCAMASVCGYLREKCRSDHFWEKHMKKKWGRLISDAALREWHSHVASKRVYNMSYRRSKRKDIFGLRGSFWPFSWTSPDERRSDSDKRNTDCSAIDSIMYCYLSLENGKLWFPAQVYNRENKHVGFMLSCYDAKLCYDSKTDTFRARYSPHGWRMMEENITWDRLRAPTVETPAHVLHVSDCLHDLKPDDHIEIQWRRKQDYPYGWWYGVIGHLETCDETAKNCCCHSNDTVVVEFRQFKPGSPWRQTIINRKDHREIGNEADGFYGGIRKLNNSDEIFTWKGLWPKQLLE